MLVKELIKQLEQCDPEKFVSIYVNDDTFNITMIDTSMADRIDINAEDITYAELVQQEVLYK